MRKILTALLLAFSSVASAQEVGETLSQLPQATTPLSGSELFYVVQGGLSKQTVAGALAFPAISALVSGNNTWTGTNTFTGAVTLPAGTAATNLGFTPIRVFNVTDYGAICNGSSANAAADTAGINAAIAAANVGTGAFVDIPANQCFINATIVITKSGIIVRGQGELATTITPTGAFDAFDFGYVNAYTNSHVGLRDLTISWASVPASGYCFGVLHTYYMQVQNVFCNNPNGGMNIGPSYFGEYDNVRFLSSYTGGSTGTGINFYGDSDPAGAGNHPNSNYFNNIYMLSPAGGAFNYCFVDATSEDTNFVNFYCNGAGTNDVLMSVQAATGGQTFAIQNTRFTHLYTDNSSNQNCGFKIVGTTNGNIVDTKINGLTSSGEAYAVGAGSYQGFCTQGPVGTIADLQIVNANLYTWAGTGFNFQSGSNIQLTNVTSQDNYANGSGSGGTAGFDIGANVRGLSATNVSAGGSTYGAETQHYGWYIEAGASNVSIMGGSAIGNTVAPVSVGSTVTTSPSTINITNVLGFNGNRACVTTTAASTVAQYNPTFSAANVIVSGGTVTAIAINGTATGLTSGSFSLGSQDRLTETYSVQPTTTWCGQ